MTSNYDSGADPDANPDRSGDPPGPDVQTQLVEALVHVLVEKGVLTKNDALNVVQTVANVKLGQVIEDRRNGVRAKADLAMLERMYGSFEALSDGPGALIDGINVHRLRPPIHRDRPEFPRDD